MEDILETHHAEEEFITSEADRNWTEQSSESKLIQINTILDENEGIEKIQELKPLIEDREYRQFQHKVCMNYNKCNWRLWQETLDFFTIFINKEKERDKLWYETQANLEELMSRVGDYDNMVDSLKITHAENKHLSRFQTLSEAEYNNIFSWKEEISQWQIADCYLVSWINELAETNYFDTLMRTSISREEFEDGALWYCIKIPLWNPDGRKIYIKDSEISQAKIKWNIWFKLLEIAYTKNRRTDNDIWNAYSPVTDTEFKEIEYGWTHDVLWTFLGQNNIEFNDFWTSYSNSCWFSISSLPNVNKQQIRDCLKNFDWTIWNKFISLWTKWNEGWDSVPFRVWKHTLFHCHAYSVSSVEKNDKWEVEYINIKNPRNDESIAWWTNMKLTFNEFCKAFSFFWMWIIKVDRFLNTRPIVEKSA